MLGEGAVAARRRADKVHRHRGSLRDGLARRRVVVDRHRLARREDARVDRDAASGNANIFSAVRGNKNICRNLRVLGNVANVADGVGDRATYV